MSTYVQKITACAFLHHKGKVLVAQRSLGKKFLPGIYELPGGHIEFGEGVQAGLVREIKEELGIDIIVGDPYHVFAYLNNDQSEHTVEIMFMTRLVDPNQAITIREEELAGYEWVYRNQIGQYLANNPEEFKAAEMGFDLIA